MYCDFCGKNLFYKGKYCRYCGRQVQERFSDTQPLPIVDEAMLRYPLKFKTTDKEQSRKWWRIVQRLVAVLILGLLIYVLVTFKTIKEYQILMGVVGSIFVGYLWWKS